MDEPFPELGKNQAALSCVGLLPLIAYLEFLPVTLSYFSLCVLAFLSATPMGLPTLQLRPYFSICLLSTLEPSQLNSSGIQLSQNTWKIPVSKFFQVRMTLVEIFYYYIFFLRKHLFIPFLYCITGRVSGCIMKRLGWAACILLQTCLSVEGECPKSWDQKSAGLVLTSQLNSLQGFCWVCKQQQRRKTSVLKWCNCSWLFPGGSCLTGQDDLTC